MENGEIEKLKEAAFKLAEMFRDLTGITPSDEEVKAIAAVEAFRPKVEPMERWAVKFEAGGCEYYAEQSRAIKRIKLSSLKMTLHHLREVTPAPEWVRWDVDKVTELHGERHWKMAFQDVADAHNAEMKRVTGTEGK